MSALYINNTQYIHCSAALTNGFPLGINTPLRFPHQPLTHLESFLELVVRDSPVLVMVQCAHDGVQNRVPSVAHCGQSFSRDETLTLWVTEGKYLAHDGGEGGMGGEGGGGAGEMMVV